MAGRPSKFKHSAAEEICRRLALGESLVKICATDEMVDISTVFRWLDKNDEFRDMYAHAREAHAELYANQIIDIADETPITEQPDPDGGVTLRIDSAGVQRNKLRVDARKWVAAKLLPRKYGERMLNEVRGKLAVTLEALVCGEDASDD
jgi:Bacteriophage Sf6, terminase small subunit-like